MNYNYMIFVLLFCVAPLMGMAEQLRKYASLLEAQIITIEKTGDELLSTGQMLQSELLNVINGVQKNIPNYLEALELPRNALIQPMFTLRSLVKKEIKDENIQKMIIDMLNQDVVRQAIENLFKIMLQQVNLSALPTLLENLTQLLKTADQQMISVEKQFKPFVLELNSFVDIEQAKRDLNLPSDSYRGVTLKFVSSYPEYVQKIYAQNTNGGTFDVKNIYKNLWATRNHFAKALEHLKGLIRFLSALE